MLLCINCDLDAHPPIKQHNTNITDKYAILFILDIASVRISLFIAIIPHQANISQQTTYYFTIYKQMVNSNI